ncbi:OmpA family protein [Mucilaginibacter sp. McL0603]|uniref:OmpA family protein n=1 Tax=Mucilaginibacter sp. McL0603 TaxID=3415670 RepID=UPI003CEB221B
MKFLKSNFSLILILTAIISLQACKAKKKIVQEPPPPAENPAQPVQQTPPPPPPAPDPQPVAPAPAPPDYNFSNIQFEFDSGILTTESYPILDKAAAEMKKDPSITFLLKGYASAEGTDEHNMQLSIDRANSVKAYLVNTGVSAANLTTQGYGESNPVADNSTEAGRIINRRVEIKKH